MNPLRLAALDASPFCFAKRGGIKDAFRSLREGERLRTRPARFAKREELGTRPSLREGEG